MSQNSKITRRAAYWFPAKRYGWGWGPPVVWQGWAVMALFAAALAFGAAHWLVRGQPEIFLGYSTLLCVALAAICWWKGERPGWRWGGR